ncbi:hypothetical protein SAMN05421879_1161 [Ornithinimicrobium cerasi]|uniref:Uncharacterized protein n=1 Tax=Ornithinimicrobium cerasi TaxID=2248773 RepID=A0A285VUQ2_9MICO|nr:hypothetical protein SAMN05421879_1161 [Ornithinimicrobium cerasi]
MTRYYRRGHWRTARDGSRHWVSGHTVDRYGPLSWSPPTIPLGPVRTSFTEPYRWPNALPPVEWEEVPAEHNATCPVCGAAVWFYRNKQGGCAYFDVLGRPWTLHPCMAGMRNRWDRAASVEAKARYIDGRPRSQNGGEDPPTTSSTNAKSGSGPSPQGASLASRTSEPLGVPLDGVPFSVQRQSRSAAVLWWMGVVATAAWVLGIAFAGHTATGVREPQTFAYLVWFAILPLAITLRSIVWSFKAAQPPDRISPIAFTLALFAGPPVFAAATFCNVATLGIGIPLAGLLWSGYMKRLTRGRPSPEKEISPRGSPPPELPKAGSRSSTTAASPGLPPDAGGHTPAAQNEAHPTHLVRRSEEHENLTAEQARIREVLLAYLRRRIQGAD